MKSYVVALLVSLLPQAGPTDVNASFDERFKRATGPAQLRQLDSWCAKNKMAEERKKVQDLLTKAAARPDAREPGRIAGDQARQAVGDFRDGRAKAVAEEVKKILAWMATEKYAAPDAKERLNILVKGLLAEEPRDRDALLTEIKAVENADRSGEDLKKAAGAFDGQVKSILKKFTSQIFGAVEKCIAAGEAGYAFDLYRFLLQVDPDNERAHRSLGEQKIESKWLRPFEQEQWRAGLAWDEKAGWVPIKQRDKVDQGEIYDTVTKQWGKSADLDKQHSDPPRAWRMESEHFELISSADHAVNVQLLTRMEAFFLQAFRQYDLFFTGKGGGKAASMVFGVVPTRKKLTVNYYRDEAQFKQYANPPTTWAAGFYSGGQHASFFYHLRGQISATVMQHELTHQILGEYSDGGGSSGPWLHEGAAVFLEDADFRNGTLSLGGLKDNHDIAGYRNNLRGGMKEHSLKYVLETFGPGKSWDQGEIGKNYRGAGAVVYFLMNFDGGRYRNDMIQLLRDGYFAKPKPMEEYFGMTISSLDVLMDRYYRECDVP